VEVERMRNVNRHCRWKAGRNDA